MKVFLKKINNLIKKLATPANTIVLSFAIIIIIGTILLSLPIATRSGNTTSLLDSFFTATSATCVTGLVVVDTATHWSLFGQLVILTLIQIGGLGLVTIATFLTTILRKKIGLKSMKLAQESINHFSLSDAIKLIQKLVFVVFGIELAGAMILSTVFVPKFGLKGIYMGVFHSISAFCNAGFDINGNPGSFIGYNDNPLIIYTLCLLIIVGGLGYMVWDELYLYRKTKKLTLHTQVVLITSSVLVVVGFLFFLLFEYNNPHTLGDLPFLQKINAAFFHSVNTRTAGFATLNLNELSDISKVFSVFLMFIGGASGSTAGGIKVTTFAVVIIAVISQIKGSTDTILFKKRIPLQTVMKALTLIVLGVAISFFVTTLLMAFEQTHFINTLFESVSAFGTVGLSTGLTSSLSVFSKIVIILTMFCGRIGPLTFAVFLTLRNSKTSDGIIYPDAKIVVG